MALSGGERRRCEIARALAADPSIMLLDEPFAGIDPISIADIRELVRELKSRDIGVLITDHNVRETLDIVDRACIIYDGQVLFAGHPRSVGRRPGGPAPLPRRELRAVEADRHGPGPLLKHPPIAVAGHDAAAARRRSSCCSSANLELDAFIAEELSKNPLLEAQSDEPDEQPTGDLGSTTAIGGVVVDGGTFDWAASERFKADFVDPDPSYHGISYTAAFGNLAFILKLRVQGLRDIGAALSPFNAFLFLQGLETLPLRITRHSENALAIAKWLETRPEVTWVSYPGLESHPWYKQAKQYLKGGFGGIVTFGVKGGVEAGRRLIDSVQIFSLLANVGDAKSLIIHPGSTTHSQLDPEEQAATGVTDDLIRLSVGLEHVDDLIADLTQALQAATADVTADGELVGAAG